MLALVIGLAVTGVLLLSGRWRDDADSTGAAMPSLSTSEGRIVDADGRAVKLRGVNVIPLDAGNPSRAYPAAHFRRIRDAGFNVARFVLYWRHLEPERGRFDETRLRAIDTAISRARRAGVYVVLDAIHLYDGMRNVPGWARAGGDPLASVERDAAGYLRMLARRYGRDPAVAAYDLINEPPTYPPDQNRVLRVYAGLIGRVREVDPDTIVMIEPSYGDSSMAGADLGLLPDRRNLVLSLHDYYTGGAGDGYLPNGEQNHQANGAGHYAWDGTTGYAGSPGELGAHLDVNLRVARAAGIPVWIGEFGMNPRAPGAARWIRDKIALFEREGLGWAWWLYAPGPGFNLLDEQTQRPKPVWRQLSRR